MTNSKRVPTEAIERQKILLIYSALVILQIILCSCAAVQFKQGLHLEGGLNSFDADADGNVDILRLQDPPMMVRLGQFPKTHVLTVGPYILVPLPVIPWPPGIISALSSGHRSTHSNDRFQIFVTFSSIKRFGLGVKEFDFSPKNVELIVRDAKLHPILCSYSSYEYLGGYDQKHRRETTGCFSETADGYIYLHANPPLKPPSNCEEMQIILTFDIPYSSVKDAKLNIGDVVVDGRTKRVRSIAIKHDALALWWGPKINS